MYFDFLFIRSYGEENALARLQSSALIQGLRDLNITVHLLEIRSDVPVEEVPQHKYLIYHYDDGLAINLAMTVKKFYKNSTICLGSDIYSVENYTRLSEFTDFYFMPTELHKIIISSVTSKSVAVLNECIDPIAYPSSENKQDKNSELGRNKIVWFGYPESFEKSFKYLVPVIANMIPADELVVITKGFKLLNNVEHREFEVSQFYRQTSDAKYSLLSHFSYDNQLNTWIKSPNKLITSLVRGIVPFVSSTPAYAEIMERYNLKELLFSTPSDLGKLILKRDRLAADCSQKIAAAVNDLEKVLSCKNIAKQLLNLV
jgi:hypothetical protein